VGIAYLLLEEGLQLRCHFGITDMTVEEATRRRRTNRRKSRRKRTSKWETTEGKEGHCRLFPEVTGESPKVTSYHVIFFLVLSHSRDVTRGAYVYLPLSETYIFDDLNDFE
jgi:hypothetical protein